MNKAKLAESMAEYCWALLRQDGGGTAAAYGWISRKGGSWNPAALLVAMESVHQGRTRQGCTVTFVKGWAMIQVDAEEEAVPDAAIAVRKRLIAC